MTKNKKLAIAAVILVTAAAIMATIYIYTRPHTAQGAKAFTVEVVHSDGVSKVFTYHTGAAYLGEALLAEGLIAGEDSQYGLFLITVDGEDAVWEEDGAYWALYEGEEYAMQGISTTPVRDGGAFSLVYTID